MADVIGGQQETVGPICIFSPEDVNTRKPPKQQSYEQPPGTIKCGFALHVLSVSLPGPFRKTIFQADSFLQRGIVDGGYQARCWL